MPSELIRALERHAHEWPDEVALFDAERRVSWRELRVATAALAARFAALGERPRVLVVAQNGASLATAILAALEGGAELYGLSPRTPPAARAELAAKIAARLVLAEDASVAHAERLHFPALLAGGVPARFPAREGALLHSTSGTSGAPRIARRSARAVDFTARGTAEGLGLAAGDRALIAVPLFHAYGVDHLLAALMAGCGVELHAGFNPAAVRRSLFESGITHLPAVPTMLDALARLSRPTERPPRLRTACAGGSPLPERVAEAFAARFELIPRQIYGLSELGTVAIADPDGPLGCVGPALPGADLRILDRNAPNPEKPLSVGEEGVVAVAGPLRFDGYVDGTDAGGEHFVTGDLGRLDARGRLWLTGRVSLLIDIGTLKVNPLEVEALLMRHPDVREAVVLPLAFADTAARLRAVIIPEPGAAPTRDELRRFARQHLIDYKVPRVFDVREEVPRSPSGKILRGELARQLEAGEP